MLGRNPIRRCTKQATTGALLALIVLAGSACSGGGDDGGQSTSLGSVFAGRPRLSVSAAESHPGSGVEQLDFFDTLEKRDLVSHDDTLHAVLLLISGQSGQTYVQRAGRAKQMGILDVKFDRPPREAATIGEIAQLIAGGMKRSSASSESSAVADLKELNILPEFIGENSGVSGAQLLTILGHAEDAMANSPSRVAPRDESLRPLTAEDRELASLAVFSSVQPDKKPPVRKAPIDLEKDAKKPRPGQVLPEGTPAPEPTPVTPVPAPNTPANPAPDVTPAPATPTENPSASTPRPLPPPRADGGVPSRTDGVASDLRYVAVDRAKIEVTDVIGPSEFIQWRVVDDGRGRPGDWQTLVHGDPINDRIEIRTGIGARVSITVEGAAGVVVHRLTRARIERKIRSDGQWQVGVTIYRGMVEATGVSAAANGAAGEGGGGGAVVVRTPDQVFPLRTHALFEYDAFKGTIAREFRP